MKKEKYYAICCVVAILLGTLLHFAYDISNRSSLLGLFTPVNESVWEHLKLVIVPIVIFAIVTQIIRRETIFFSSFFASVIASLIIIAFHYLSVILASSSTAVDIIIYILAMCITFYIIYILSSSIPKNLEIAGVVLLLAALLLFAIFTVFPPKLQIFLDMTTNTYGIFP